MSIISSPIRPVLMPHVMPIIGAAVRLGIFNPLRLFAQGEQGAWYDPSDLTTLYQDSAGTTPVTAHGQPVGLMLDKSGNGNHASQPTAASRPLFQDVGGLRYLKFDGVDDFLVTGSINFTGTDKVSVFAGVRKLSDAAVGMLCELSGVTSTNSGSLAILAPRDTTYEYGLFWKGTVSPGAGRVDDSALAAPVSNTLYSAFDLSGTTQQAIAAMRINGTLLALTFENANLAGGNFGNYPLYIGRRGGTTLPFNGNLYGLVIRGALTDDPTTIKVENLLAGKTGVQF